MFDCTRHHKIKNPTTINLCSQVNLCKTMAKPQNKCNKNIFAVVFKKGVIINHKYLMTSTQKFLKKNFKYSLLLNDKHQTKYPEIR